MSQFKFTELRALGDFLELRHIRVTREQRRFAKNLLLTFMQTRHPAVTTYRIDMGDEAIGYFMLIHAENPVQWIIERLTIDQDHQRKGHGHAIVLLEFEFEEDDDEESDDEETDDEETDDEETGDEESDDEESDDEESDGKSVEPSDSDDDDD